ncbi:MAG: 2-oxoacid:acceptor oxidoreductase family protein, partial [Muribaculaceae bacterium]|nr:2-oxoacid:acceptor oxidoreductase family protein [Muribaculaceae bacterium]
MLENTNVKTLDKVVVRFSGDSGDGMQLAGNIFTNVSAGLGNQVSTFPDYPAEIRAPQGSLGGVSGFQVSVGQGVHTPGDACDVLVAMNAAALKTNHRFLKPGGVIIVDIDSFREADLKKAQYTTDNPFEELGIKAQIVEVPVTTLTKAALADSGMDNKSVLKCRNIFTLGLICWLFDRPLDAVLHHLRQKFAKKPAIFEANAKVLQAGYDYGHNIHANVSTYRIETSTPTPGVYTDINGNTATAWGL